MKYFKKLIGKRVYLSPMNPDDAELYAKWMNDFSVADGLGGGGRVVTAESERNWVTKNANEQQFAIVTLDGDKLIGNCGIQNVNHIRQCAEVGVFIGDEGDRNRGYGTEALLLLTDYGFDYLNLHNIMLQVFSFNERAIKCYQKVGFKECGRRREAYCIKGRRYDEVSMDMLVNERQK